MQTVQTKYFQYGEEEINHLSRVDEVLGAAIQRMGKIERVIIPDLFAALVHAIVGQLISAKAAHTIWNRMQDRLGEITPRHIAAQSVEHIQQCGITRKKAVCIHELSQLISEGTFSLDALSDLSDTDVINKLTSLNGIGKWTAEMLLIHSMERPDIVSWGDIAIRRGMMKLYGHSSITKQQFDHYRRQYTPFGSVASIYLWEISFE
ncbi:DNA-3-methyladenine glycosylase family protein [Paenibacillus rigui]|uniref:DNA-3-methyladenine glycosylase II n=1 Tax=Paenibacillus rigui TaxID=554312 RepID=A0A229UJ78_9BACL|nr:DNA-3-methyladenine glycosylase [Paenibacillus rigui]OXM83424.1 DNA-3-methyladenine glycosidase [Paenibacillus rigui]